MFNSEAVIIESFDDNQLLNKKSKLIITCWQINKLLLKGLKKNSRNDAMEWVICEKNLLTKKYFKKQYPVTEKHCKILTISTHLPINTTKTITTAPT